MSHLAGRAAAITGSSRGIGRSVALALAAEGAAVVINGRESEAVEQTAGELEANGARVAHFAGSVAQDSGARALIECCRDSFGGIDILINCAGTAEPEGASIFTITPQQWQEQIDTHLTAAFNTCRHAAPAMRDSPHATIVNTSSTAWLGIYGGTGYAAGKGGVNSLTFALAAELREHGIRVNAVCPGARTRLSTGPAYERRIRDLNARGILSDAIRDASLEVSGPEHTAPIYSFLSADLSSPITGRLFTASGGYVGVRSDRGGEQMLAWRDAAEGPWPIAALGDRIHAGLQMQTVRGVS